MRSAASPLDSMKMTSRDPRLNASKPTAPVPAKTSRKTVPETVRTEDVEERFLEAITGRAQVKAPRAS